MADDAIKFIAAQGPLLRYTKAVVAAAEKATAAIEDTNKAVETQTPDPDAEIDPETGNVIVQSTIAGAELVQIEDPEDPTNTVVTATPKRQQVIVELETQGRKPTEAPTIADEEGTPTDSGAPTRSIGPMLRAAKSGERGLG